MDTLFLVDTSDSTAPIMPPLSSSVADAARALGSKAKQTALWNYSSPLSPGVTKGWRENLGFGDAEMVAQAVAQFGTGGVSQSRSALASAVDAAAEHSQSSGQVRVVLVTTGTESDMDTRTFHQQVAQPRKSVHLSVVHIGRAQPDKAIEDVADTHITVADGTDAKEMKAALEKAAGL